MPDQKLEALSPEFWNQLLDNAIRWAAGSGLRVVITLILLLIGLKVTRAFVRRAVTLAVRPEGKDALRDLMVTKRQTTLINLFDAVVTIALILVAAMMILPDIGFHVEPILASAGIAGVALGFGAQTLVKDLLSGIFIILEQQFSVGDVVRVGSLSGGVEEINLRTIVLRDSDGSVHIIPNGQIDKVTVMTRDWSRLVLDLDIAYDADIDTASAVLKKELEAYASAHSEFVLEPPEVLGVQNLAESSVQIRAWMKMLPGKQWIAGRELRASIKKAFDAAGIEIPFPQRTLWVRGETLPTPDPERSAP
ncbi:MAG TPA: mechanosensitive ion channel family protein [Chthoniobacterales bacterium]|nr:mechanosensitive ion channel family protein [Chthoniobacterales bacterium]